MNILLVEDDKIAANAAKRIISLFCPSAEISHAQDGSSALSIVKSNNFDFVYMDYGLPDMTGIEVSIIMREKKINIPILILSGNLSSITEDELVSAKIDAAFSKPLDATKWDETMKIIETRKS